MCSWNSILWSDESWFKRKRVFNLHNLHQEAVENHCIIRQDRFPHQFELNSWVRILEGKIIDKFELSSRFNDLDFSKDELKNLLNEIPQEIRDRMWLQHDGALAHFLQQVTK